LWLVTCGLRCEAGGRSDDIGFNAQNHQPPTANRQPPTTNHKSRKDEGRKDGIPISAASLR
jgi:hypothetical protein